MDVRLTDPLGPARKGPGEGSATVTLCCGKVVCKECHDKYMLGGMDREAQTFPPCPFCREPTGYMDEHADKRLERDLLKRRATHGDPLAMYNLSGSFDKGHHGLPVDHQASAPPKRHPRALKRHPRALHAAHLAPASRAFAAGLPRVGGTRGDGRRPRARDEQRGLRAQGG